MRDIVWLTDTPYHRALAELPLHFGPLWLAASGLRHIRAHESRRHRIHRYAMRAKLQRESPGQDDDLGLCSCIECGARQRRAKCGDRGYVDDTPILVPAHATHNGKRRVDHTIDINSAHPLELRLIVGVESGRLGDAGIVDEDGDRTKLA